MIEKEVKMKRFLSFALVLVLAFSSVSIFVSADSTPSKVTGLKSVFVSDTSVELRWNEVKGASGYKIYKYSASTNKYTALKKISTNRGTLTGLKVAATYKFAVRAFKKVNDKVYYGDYSERIKLTTVKISKKDISLLEKMLMEMDIVDYDGDNRGKLSSKYDYKKSSYKKMLSLLDNSPVSSLMFTLFKHYGWGKYFTEYSDSDWSQSKQMYVFKKPDPLGTMGKHGYYYYKIKASKLDWIIKNVFGKKPSHDNKEIGKGWGEYYHSWKGAYYYKGYYYLPSGDGGDYIPDYVVDSKKNDEKGIYTIKFHIENPYEPYSSPKHIVRARLKLVNNKRVWSIYSIK